MSFSPFRDIPDIQPSSEAGTCWHPRRTAKSILLRPVHWPSVLPLQYFHLLGLGVNSHTNLSIVQLLALRLVQASSSTLEPELTLPVKATGRFFLLVNMDPPFLPALPETAAGSPIMFGNRREERPVPCNRIGYTPRWPINPRGFNRILFTASADHVQSPGNCLHCTRIRIGQF